MLEVNREVLYAAARQHRQQGVDSPLVVSVATFGRGIRQELLQALDRHRFGWGHNQSLVAVPPLELVQQLLKEPDWQPPSSQEPGFWGLGYAFGKACLKRLNWEESGDFELF